MRRALMLKPTANSCCAVKVTLTKVSLPRAYDAAITVQIAFEHYADGKCPKMRATAFGDVL